MNHSLREELRPDRSLTKALEAQGKSEVYIVGDRVEPREALEAVCEGFEVGNKV